MAFSVSLGIGSVDGFAKKLKQAKAAAGGAGVEIAGDTQSGTFSGKLTGSYTVSGDTLTISITKKPMLWPEGVIKSKLTEFFS